MGPVYWINKWLSSPVYWINKWLSSPVYWINKWLSSPVFCIIKWLSSPVYCINKWLSSPVYWIACWGVTVTVEVCKCIDGMTNSVTPDQSNSYGTGWSGYTRSYQAYPFDDLG